MFIPTYGIGLAGKGLQAVAKSAKVAKGLARGERVLTTVLNSTVEAGFEAKHANDEIRDQLARQRGYISYDLLPPDIQQEISVLAGQAAARTFWGNMIGLMLPNYLESGWARSIMGFDKAGSNVRQAIRKKALSPDDIVKAKSKWKAATKGLVSEGLWEENFQEAVGQFEARLAEGKIEREDYAKELVRNLSNNAWGFARAVPNLPFAPFGVDFGIAAKAGTEQDAGATAIALGAIIGSGMSTVSQAMDNARLRESAERENSL